MRAKLTADIAGKATNAEAKAAILEYLKSDLAKAGFKDTGITGIWRRHSLWLADFGLMSRKVAAGEQETARISWIE